MPIKNSVGSKRLAFGVLAIFAILSLTSCGDSTPKLKNSPTKTAYTPSPGTPDPGTPIPYTPITPTNTNSALGTNLQAVNYYSTEWVFKDVFKMSNAYSWTQSGNCSALTFDTDGYPSTLPAGCELQALMMNRSAWSGESGQYVVLYDGTGTLSFDVSGPAPDAVSVVSSAAGRIVINLSLTYPDGHYGLWLHIRTSSAAPNNVRNIRVLRPGTEATYASQPFTDRFLSSLSGYKAIRFMDWQQTNNSTLSSWANRTRPASVSQSGPNGVAVEYMVALCNTLNADMWINIPVRATNDFVTQEATLIKNSLKPGLKVYIEYTNEMWNGGFNQSTYARAQGAALGITGADWEIAEKYYSQRAVEIFGLWDVVYGVDARTSLVRVMASQLANAGVTTTALNWAPPGGTPASQHVDAVAVAPYFCGNVGNGDISSWDSAWAANQATAITSLIAYCASDTSSNIHTWQAHHYDIIHNTYGLRMIAYEAGQGMVGVGQTNQTDAAFNALLNAANNDSRMLGLYTTFLNQWKADNGQLLMNYTSSYEPTQYGYWGLLRWSGDDPATAYKYRGVKEWITPNPQWW